MLTARCRLAYWARGVMKNGRRFGSAPKRYEPPAQPTAKINVSDPDSRNVKTPRGWLQGYNAQAVCNEQQIVLAAEISVSSADFGLLGPMLAAAERELTAAAITTAPGVVLGDAGYWHGEQMDELTGRGVQVLIAPDGAARRGARRGVEQRTLRLHASRPIRRAIAMAADHRRRQPAQAPPPPTPTREPLTRAGAAAERNASWLAGDPAGSITAPVAATSNLGARVGHQPRRRPTRTINKLNAFTQQPPWKAKAALHRGHAGRAGGSGGRRALRDPASYPGAICGSPAGLRTRTW